MNDRFELKLFNNPEFGELHMIEIDGKPYAGATEVAVILGYANPNGAIRRHCRWVRKQTVPHPQSINKTIEMNFIPEGDLYRLIVNSQKPDAEIFASWIFDEIIPSIIKTGSYGLPQLSQNELILKIAESNVQLEKEVQSLKESQNQIEQKLDTAIKVFSSPSSDTWKDDMNNIIDEMARTYKLSPVKLRGNMYKDLEKTGVYLTSRVNRIKSRMKKHGASYRECLAVTKMDAISHDKKLMAIFEGIVKKYQATYSIKEEEL